MKKMQRIDIDLSKMKEIVRLSVRRTTVFLGLGINAAEDESFKKYQLEKHSPIILVPQDADEKTIRHFKEEFGLWIIMNGFRELIESFSIFLDSIFYSCLIVTIDEKRISNKKKTHKGYVNKGLNAKFIELETVFDIEIAFRDCIYSINQARNCLAHRRGVVSKKDCINDVFTLKWMKLEVFVRKEDGSTKTLILPIPEGGTQAGGRIGTKLVEDKLEFNIGDVIKLTPKQLSEICYFFILLAEETIKKTVEYLEQNGALFKNETDKNSV